MSAERFESIWRAWPDDLPRSFTSCTPAMVRNVIRAARAAGWRPEVNGPDLECSWSSGENAALQVRRGGDERHA